MKNNYVSKTIRTITSVLPIENGRKGSCIQCGECCKLPNPCIFMDKDKASCKAYSFRPLNCRKYPRSEKEHLTQEKCGFYFEDEKNKKPGN